MEDRLAWLLNYFQLRARVFQAGPLCHSSRYDAQDGLGYIHVLKKGKLNLESSGQSTLLLEEPSVFFFMNPITHSLHPQDDDVDLVCASIDFGAGFSNPISQTLPEIVLLKLEKIPSLSTAIGLMFTESEEKHCGRQVVLDRLIEVIIVQLLRELMDQQRLQVGLLAGLAEPKLSKAINAIHADPAYPWTLQDLANVAGMSRARFATKFRDIVGTTMGNYLTEWRISVAQTFLVQGKSVQLIADAVGYANASALSRAFTAHMGLSPTDWKKKHNTANQPEHLSLH